MFLPKLTPRDLRPQGDFEKLQQLGEILSKQKLFYLLVRGSGRFEYLNKINVFTF